MALRTRSIIELLINAKDRATAQINKIGSSLSGLAKAAKLASGALAAGFGATLFGGGIRSAAEFEKALDRIQAVTRSSESEMNKLRDAANRAGSETKFTASEAAAALENLVRSGKSANEAISLLPSTLQLATAESLELAEAADFITKSLAQFNLGVDQTQRVIDVLVATSQSANTNVTGVATALRDVGVVAQQSGLSIEETAAAIGVLANSGIEGQRAGVALRNILAQLSDPASTARQELRNLGITTDDFNTIIKELGSSSRDTEKVLLAFGREPAAAIRTLVQQSDQLGELSNNFQNVTGRAEEAARIMSENLTGATTRLSSAWDGLSRTVAQPFVGPITDAINALAGFVQRTSGFIRRLISDLDSLFDSAGKVSGLLTGLFTEEDAKTVNKYGEAIANTQIQLDNTKKTIERAKQQLTDLTRINAEGTEDWRRALGALRNAELQYRDLTIQQRQNFDQLDDFVNRIRPKVDAAAKKEQQTLKLSAATIADVNELRSAANREIIKTPELLADLIRRRIELNKAETKGNETLSDNQRLQKVVAETLKETNPALAEAAKRGLELGDALDFSGSLESVQAYLAAVEKLPRILGEGTDHLKEFAEESKRINGELVESSHNIRRQTTTIQSQIPFWDLLGREGQQALKGILEQSNRTADAADTLADKVENVATTLTDLGNVVQKLSSARVITPQLQAQIDFYGELADEIRKVERAQDKLNEEFADGTLTLQELERVERLALQGIRKLDAATLQNLRSQVQQIREEFEQFRQEAEKTRESLQERLLSIRGEEEALKLLRLQREQLEIQEDLRKARLIDDQVSIKALQESLKLLKEISEEEGVRLRQGGGRPAPLPAPTTGNGASAGAGFGGTPIRPGERDRNVVNINALILDQRDTERLARKLKPTLDQINRLSR